MNTGELEGDTEAAVVLVEGKKCFGRAKLNVCDGGAFACLLDTVTAGRVVEFKTLMLKGNKSRAVSKLHHLLCRPGCCQLL